MQLDLAQYVDFEALFRECLPRWSPGEKTTYCIFHDDDKTKSLSVDVEKGLVNDHGACSRGWNYLQVWAFTKFGDEKETKRAWKDLFNIWVPDDVKKSSQGYDPKVIDIYHSRFKTLPGQMREWLRDRRGWSDAWIDKAKLRWVGKPEMRLQIPVYDEEGYCMNVRRYDPNPERESGDKFWNIKGRRGSFIFPHPDIFLEAHKRPDKRIWVCEGELDTLCALSHGLPAACQTSGAGKWDPRYSKLFKDLNVIIAYDNDEAGRNGREKVANSVGQFGQSVAFVTWPEFMEVGEDVSDFLVKHQKTVSDLENLALEPFDILLSDDNESSDQQAQQPGSDLFTREGAYWWRYQLKNRQVEDPVSNFTLEVLQNFLPPGESIVRRVRLTHERGHVVDGDLPSNDMDYKRFPTWCLSKGDFVWSGNRAAMNALWTGKMQNTTGQIVIQPDHVGYLPSSDLWLFPEYALSKGDLLKPDEENVIWNGTKGYQAIGLMIKDDASISQIPNFRADIARERAAEIRQQFAELLYKNIGSYSAFLALGFVAANAYAPEIYREFRLFPILYVYGRYQCGKNTFVSMLMDHFGLSSQGIHLANVSQVALTRMMSYYSGVPVWVDEYRNDKTAMKMDTILRAAFDRTLGGKGKIGYGVVSNVIRSSLIISGEHCPADQALASRCGLVQLSPYTRNDEYRSEYLSLLPQLSSIMHWMIRDKTTESVTQLVELILAAKKDFETRDYDPRLATIYAILAACFVQLYYPEMEGGQRDDFLDWLHREAHAVVEEKEEQFVVSMFFQDLEALRHKKLITSSHMRLIRIFKDGRGKDYLALWFPYAFSEWSTYRRQTGATMWEKQDLMKYLQDEPWFHKRSHAVRFGSDLRKCILLDVDAMPPGITDTLDDVEGDDWTIQEEER
jgi:hypothetical protein